MENKKIFAVLFLIIFFGFLLRIYDIGEESFWIDEAATVYTTQQNPSDIIKDIYFTTKHAPEYFDSGGTPPFYFLVANYWTRLVGLSEAKLRLLSALTGVLSIYMIFLVGRFIFDYKVGLLSAFLLSINYIHINYSQEARTYSLIIFLTLLSVYLLINALRKKKTGYWISYVLTNTALIYSHYFGFFIIFFEFLYLLIFWKIHKKSLNNIIISAFGILILYLLWVPALIKQIIGTKLLSYLLGQNIIFDLAKILIQLNSWFTPDMQTRIALRNLYHHINGNPLSSITNISLIGAFTIVSILALSVVMWWCFSKALLLKNNKLSFDFLYNRVHIFLLMWFMTPMILPIFFTILFPQSPVFGYTQYILFASPAYYLLVSKGMLKTKNLSFLLAIFVILTLLPLYSYYANIDKDQWREVAKYLELNRPVEEPIVVFTFSSKLALRYYYKDAENVIGVKSAEDLKSKINNKNSLWLVYSADVFFDREGTIKNYLDSNYKIDKRREFVGVRIFHYVK